jgi:hypothetical protein
VCQPTTFSKPSPSCSGLDDALQNRVRPVRKFPTVVRRREHPVRISYGVRPRHS